MGAERTLIEEGSSHKNWTHHMQYMAWAQSHRPLRRKKSPIGQGTKRGAFDDAAERCGCVCLRFE